MEIARQLRQIGKLGGEHICVERHLGMREQNRELGARQSATRRGARRERLVIRQILERAVESSGALQFANQPGLAVERGRPARLGDG